MWTTAIFGVVSALLGVVAGQLLSGVREHHEWVNDQKRLEYRQLLGQLYETVTVVSDSRPNLRDLDPRLFGEAVNKLARVISDRIFISDALKESGVVEDWYELKQVIFYEPEMQQYTSRELQFTQTNLRTREDRLREKILELAKADIVKFKFFGMIEE
jgi:hypothetical protein